MYPNIYSIFGILFLFISHGHSLYSGRHRCRLHFNQRQQGASLFHRLMVVVMMMMMMVMFIILKPAVRLVNVGHTHNDTTTHYKFHPTSCINKQQQASQSPFVVPYRSTNTSGRLEREMSWLVVSLSHGTKFLVSQVDGMTSIKYKPHYVY